jgi:hypothetical protein
MTVSTTTSRVSHSGNGSTVTFTVPFYFIYSTDLKVYKTSSANVQTLLVEGTDYTVTGAGVISGGSITCTTAPSSDYTIIIYRDPDTTQLVDYQANDPFPAETHERALDKLTMLAQRLNDVNDRSFHLSDGDASGASLEISSPEANYLIGWNSTGDALQNVDPATLATVVSFATAYADTFTGDGTTTSWTLSRNPAVLYNLDVSINGVTQVPVTDYTLSGTTFTTTTAAPLNSVILVKYKEGLPNYSGDSQDIRYVSAATGAKATTVQAKLRETVSVLDFDADKTGLINSTTAFTNARAASGGRYFIPSGTYLVDASPDVWADAFTAAGNTYIKIGVTTYDISNAFAGRLRYVVASNVLTWITDAVTGNQIIGIQNSAAGTATYFKRGLAFTTDSHFIQCQPSTNGGETDLLFQRSTLNADPAGNRFNITFQESVDRLNLSYATTASGAPAFDSFMQIYAGTSPALTFPAIPLMMNQGWKMQTRAGGALKLSYTPTSATVATLQDDTSGNVLETTTRSYKKIAGTYYNTLLDVPSYKESPTRWSGSFGDLLTDTFPVNKTLFTLTGATRYTVIGTMRVACVASGGGAGEYRETRFVHNGTTLTLTDIVNTITNFTATIAMSGSNIQFQGSYSGGLGGGYAVSVSIEWCHVGR